MLMISLVNDLKGHHEGLFKHVLILLEIQILNYTHI